MSVDLTCHPTHLTGHVTIVTGAAQGIGAAIAATFAARGARVVIADINEDEGKAVAKEIGAEFFTTDASNVRDVEAVVDHVTRTYGRLHSIVNNAGITKFVDFFEIDDDHWNRVQDINARSQFFFIRAGARYMRDNGGGAFVNISSIAAKGYRQTSSAAYAASKGAVLGLTRAAAMQLAKYSIRVNAICPGIIITPLNAKWLADNPSRVQEIPLSVPCHPRDIGALAAFLASDQAAVITGQSWNVDGGLTID